MRRISVNVLKVALQILNERTAPSKFCLYLYFTGWLWPERPLGAREIAVVIPNTIQEWCCWHVRSCFCPSNEKVRLSWRWIPSGLRCLDWSIKMMIKINLSYKVIVKYDVKHCFVEQNAEHMPYCLKGKKANKSRISITNATLEIGRF